MIRGLYTSGLGMTVQMQKLDVVSNNLANVNTTGFKKDTAITQSFSEELAKRLNNNESSLARLMNTNNLGTFSQGLFVDNVHTDFSNGSLTNTDGALDLAISGGGFFTVRNPSTGNEFYTRNGSFSVGADRVLTTKDGNQVLGRNGTIVVPNGNITIDTDGRIFADSQYIDTLKMVDFEDTTVLRKQGGELYTAINENGLKNFTGSVEQGFLETSNVNSVKEMVEMINITRAYEANQRMILTHDTMLGKAVNDIARK